MKRTAAVVFVFLDWDDGREELVRKAVEADCVTRVFIVGNREPEKGLNEAAL